MSSSVYSSGGGAAVTLANAKLRLDIAGTDHDTEITDLITAATRQIEECYNLALLNTTRIQRWDMFPSGRTLTERSLRPDRSPLSSVTSITYIDGNGDSQTLAASKYDVDTDSRPGRISEAFGETWPTTREQVNAVTVTYVAGYGAATTDVPADIQQAIFFAVKAMFEGCEKDHALQMAVEMLANQYAIVEYV